MFNNNFQLNFRQTHHLTFLRLELLCNTLIICKFVLNILLNMIFIEIKVLTPIVPVTVRLVPVIVEKLLGFARIHSIVKRGSASLSCATIPHLSCFS